MTSSDQLDDVPLVAAALTGYRTFTVTDEGLGPVATTGMPAWTAPVTTASCHRDPRHRAPELTCACGLYAWWRAEDAMSRRSSGQVTAVVQGSGRVAVGAHGFRAERASVVAVLLPPRHTTSPAWRERVAQVVGERYPDAALVDGLRQLVRRFPHDDLSALGVATEPTARPAATRRFDCVWAAGVFFLYSVIAWPQHLASILERGAWIALVIGFAGWQAVLVVHARRSIQASSTTTPDP